MIQTKIYKAEKKSTRCPICFCNNLSLCTHSIILKKNTRYTEPFIGCYNNIVYKDIKIPNHLLTSYDQFILRQLDEFTLRFNGKPSSWENYRLELMQFFYLPIANFAKENNLLPNNFILSIKGETFVADEEDNDSIDLGAPVVGDGDEQQLPSSPNIVINISVNTSTGNSMRQHSSLFQPLYKTTAIKKKSNIRVSCQTNSQVATQKVVVVDENKKLSSLMVLNLEDFATLQSFHQALRREMSLDGAFTFQNLRFKLAKVHDHSITVKGCEMKVLSQFVQEGKYDTIEFKYGN